VKQDIVIAGFGRTLGDDDPNEPKSRILRSFRTLVNSVADPDGSQMIQLFRSEDLPWLIEIFKAGDEKTKQTIKSAGEQSGDSGGPAYVTVNGEHFVAGVASGYDNDGFPEYENAANHLNWIREASKELGASAPTVER
jgi:hypothetical protein